MDIKHIHVLLIIVSILMFLGFGVWLMHRHFFLAGNLSFVAAVGLVFYCIHFLKKLKTINI